MLGEDAIDPQRLGCARQVIERRIALAQRNRVAKAIQNRQQFAETPHARRIERLSRAAPLPPQPFQGSGIRPVVSPALAPAGIFHLKQVSALGAAKIGPRFRARNPASAPKTAQLMQVIVHNSLVLAYQCTAILAVDGATRWSMLKTRLQRKLSSPSRVLLWPRRSSRKLHCASPPPPTSSPFCRPSSSNSSRPPAFMPKPPTRPRPCSPPRSKTARPSTCFSPPTSVIPSASSTTAWPTLPVQPIPPRPSPTPKARSSSGSARTRALPPPSLDLLRSPALKRLAIANPDRAPYGRAAVAALQSLSLYDALKPRLVTAENIAQAAQFVDSANADAGLISLTSALTPRLSADGTYFVIPRDLYPPIEQGAVIVSNTKQRAAVHKLLDFLLSPAIQAQLAKSGLTPVK